MQTWCWVWGVAVVVCWALPYPKESLHANFLHNLQHMYYICNLIVRCDEDYKMRPGGCSWLWILLTADHSKPQVLHPYEGVKGCLSWASRSPEVFLTSVLVLNFWKVKRLLDLRVCPEGLVWCVLCSYLCTPLITSKVQGIIWGEPEWPLILHDWMKQRTWKLGQSNPYDGERQTDQQRERERQTDTQRHRNRDRDRERQEVWLVHSSLFM